MAQFSERQRLASSIVFLHSITGIPLLPQRCPIPVPKSNDNRTLSAGRERQLSKDFAFLAAHSNDYKTVKAVALEEDPDGCGLTIRVAANTGTPIYARNGLQKIGILLQEAAETQKLSTSNMKQCQFEEDLRVEKVRLRTKLEDLEARLFDEIARLDFARIVSRLKSIQHGGGKKSKKAAKANATLNAITTSSSLPKIQFASKGTGAMAIEQGGRLASQYLTTPGNLNVDNAGCVESLMKLLGDFKEMKPMLQFDDSRLDRDTRVKLDQMRKLGHYKSISQSLLSTARKYPQLFGKVLAEVIPSEEIDNNHSKNLLLPFDRLYTRKKFPGLKSDQVSAMRKKYEKERKRCNDEKAFKIHAEIQLLLYYEANPPKVWPRYLSSNKKACYLCHLFIREHGGFHVPNSHGRLYHQWALPTLDVHMQKKLGSTITKFISKVEDEINVHKQSQEKHRDPIESQLSVPLAPSEVSSICIQHVRSKRPPTKGKRPSKMVNSHENSSYLLESNRNGYGKRAEQAVPSQPSFNIQTQTENPRMDNTFASEDQVAEPLVEQAPSVARSDSQLPSSSSDIPHTESFNIPKEINQEGLEQTRNVSSDSPHQKPLDVDFVSVQDSTSSEADSSSSQSVASTLDLDAENSTTPATQVEPNCENHSPHTASEYSSISEEIFEATASNEWLCYRLTPYEPLLLNIGKDHLHVCMNESALGSKPDEHIWIGVRAIESYNDSAWKEYGTEPAILKKITSLPGDLVAAGGPLAEKPLFVRSGDKVFVIKYAYGRDQPLEPTLQVGDLDSDSVI